LIFVTKYRRGALDAAMLDACQIVIRKVSADFGAELREFSDEGDPVHLLMACRRRPSRRW
jgi:putative transposase